MTKRLTKSTKGIIQDTVNGLAIGGAILVPTLAQGADLTIHNLGKGTYNTPYSEQQTRMSLNGKLGTATVDINAQGKLNEAFLWLNGPSLGNWYSGALVQGTPNTKAEGAYCDFGALVGTKIGKYTLGFIGAPTIQPNEEPMVFYEGILGGIDGDKGQLVASVVDYRSKPFTAKDLDSRVYVTGQIGKILGGIGTRNIGTDVTRVYGSAGIKTNDFGTLAIFNHNCDDPSTPEDESNTFFKVQTALGNPSESFYSVGIANLWNDMKGPGKRDVGTPYLGTFLGKGKTTAKLEGDISDKCTNYELMIGRAVDTALLGRTALGAGVNYHSENGQKEYSPLVHATADKKIGSKAKLGLEGRFGKRKNSVFATIKRSF